MERQDIKTAIDIVNQMDDRQSGHVVYVLEQCGNEIAKLQAKVAGLEIELTDSKINDRYAMTLLAEAKKDAERWKDELFGVLILDMTRDRALQEIDRISKAMEQKGEA